LLTPQATLPSSRVIARSDPLATRQKTTFQKRQKEMKRQEKQRMKADRRAQRSLAKRTGIPSPDESAIEPLDSQSEPEPTSESEPQT
jgi:hypothetical protein